MANNEDVAMDFVRQSLKKGIPKEEIEAALLKAGWTKELARNAVNTFADVDFPVPVPNLKPYLSARDTFIYLVMFVALYVSATSLLILTFNYIDILFPHGEPPAPMQWEYKQDAIRRYIAALVVSFPVYYLLSARIAKSVSIDPTKRSSKIRRWLTYLTLFITAQIVIGDLITLIVYFLDGDLSIRFLLKVLTVAMIAGGIFAQYYSTMHQDEKEG